MKFSRVVGIIRLKRLVLAQSKKDMERFAAERIVKVIPQQVEAILLQKLTQIAL